MNKYQLLAVGVLLIGGATALASCSGNKSTTADSATEDTAEGVVSELPVAERDSLAKIFDDPARRSDVATDSTYAVTASGLKYLVIKEGTGAQPTAEDAVKVNYEGRLVTGYVFDSSYERGEPISFPLNGVIRGWTEGLQLMKVGGTNIFYIPYQLGYGEQGAGQQIPPYSDLIFKVELLDIEK